MGVSMTESPSDAFHALIPELALGLLDGRERAVVLAHVERCPACQHELLLMGDVADRLVELTPRAEPPAGFETAVMVALRAARPQPSSPARPTDRRRPGPEQPGPALGAGSGHARAGRRWRPVAAGLVAAAVTASVGAGGWALGHHGARTTPSTAASAGGKAVVAQLLHDRRPVGQVVVTAGPYPWMWMAVSSSLGNIRVTCEVDEKDGKWVRFGSFELRQGFGYWAAPLPRGASPITGARVLDATGHTVATASIQVGS